MATRLSIARAPVAVAAACLVIATTASEVQTQAPPELGAFVRIDACSAPPRRGSGFVWTNASSVVTALHVVVNCPNITVRYPIQGGLSRTARLDRVIRKYDLALLAVDNAPQITPLQTATSLPSTDAPITVWGYPSVVRTLLDTQLRRRAAQGTL